MNKSQKEALLHLLALSTLGIANIDFNNKRFLIRGASGHFGIWSSLSLAFLAKNGSALKIFCETTRFNQVASILEPLSLIDYVEKAPSNGRYDVVLDFSLPPLNNATEVDDEFCKKVLAQFKSSLEQTEKDGVMISPSSGAVYGHHRFEPGIMDEEIAQSAVSRGTYGEMKYLLESLSLQVTSRKLPIYRVFTTFGPLFRSESNLVANSLFLNAQKGNPLELKSTGNKIRNFAFIGELVAQMIHLSLVESLDQLTPINLGTKDNLSIRDFTNKVGDIYNLKVKIGLDEEPFESYVPNLSKLESYKKFGTINNFDLYLEQTAKYYG
jgi:nucleoside-diphosphate-sugar epimerase